MLSNENPQIPVKKLPSNDRVKKIQETFSLHYGRKPDFYVRVPGRVNLIGEHIDYCGYGVCPMAIEQDVILAVSPTEENCILHVRNVDAKYQPHEINLNDYKIKADGTPQWYDYVLCGIKGIQENMPADTKLRGMNIVASGTIPQCAGLSSSSALVCAAALAFARVLGINYSKESLADLCAKCEKYIGTQGGGMDQAIAFLANEGCAKSIEFCPLTSRDVSLPKGATFVIAHSLAELNKAATGDFNCRVVECRLAAQIIAKNKALPWEIVKKLRDVQDILKVDLPTMIVYVKEVLHEEPYSKDEIIKILGTTVDMLNELSLTPNTIHIEKFKLRQRALHVFEEALRVEKFIAACSKASGEGVLQTLGRLMHDSHVSLRDLYQCSHTMLDELVEIHETFAVGARLTGAGWGGCTVALVLPENVDGHINHLKEKYYKKLGRGDCHSLCFVTSPNSGACIYLDN